VILIGELSLWVALLLSAWSTTASFAGGALRRGDLTQSGVRGLYASFVMVALAGAGLWTALLSRDFSLEYVAAHISENTPSVYVFTAFWSGSAGATLFWALVISMCGTGAIALGRPQSREFVPWMTGTLSAIVLFLVATTCFEANPFVRLDMTPLDGQGMDPRLQTPAAALLQPSLFIGYATTALPLAFAIAALAARRLDATWLGSARRWTLFSWVFLTIGILFGMRWAYLEPQRGTPWPLHSVETSAILPWLVAAASLHSMIAQSARPLLRKWTVVSMQLIFLLSIFAAFVTHDVLDDAGGASGHSLIGTWFSAFFFMAAGIATYLAGTRLRDIEATADLESAIEQRSRYGGYIAHVGIVVLLAALAGLSFGRRYDTTLRTGESYQATDPFGHVWRFVSQGVSQFDQADYVVAILALDAYRDGKRLGLITSERRTFRDVQGNQLFEPSTQVGMHSTAMLDTYVVPADLRRERGSDIARLHVEFNPLGMWVWVGGIVTIVGGIVALWPRAEADRASTGLVAA